MTQEPQRHWLTRPETIRRLWFVLAGVLALSVIAGAFIDIEGHFEADGIFGFFAAYGFGACIAMVVFARLLGILLKRRDTYYDD